MQVVQAHGQQITAASLKDMVYAEAVVQETMRLVPAAAVLFRRALKDFVVKGWLVPKVDDFTVERFLP